MKRFRTGLLMILALLALCTAAAAQDFEYGSPDDLKGLTAYYVDTQGDISARNKIVDEIRKALPDLALVDDMAKAQIRLNFRGDKQDVVTSAVTTATAPDMAWTTVTNRRLPVGSGLVWIDARGPDRNRPRVILNFSSRQDYKLEKAPSVKFAREFVKTYKKANGLK